MEGSVRNSDKEGLYPVDHIPCCGLRHSIASSSNSVLSIFAVMNSNRQDQYLLPLAPRAVDSLLFKSCVSILFNLAGGIGMEDVL